MMNNRRNWSGNYEYSAARWHFPKTVEQVQELVSRCTELRVLGTRHSFNGIADTCADLVSLNHLDRVVHLDRKRKTVTVEGGIKYGDLCQYLHSEGFALHNLASLPHISVAGACATATHGSGDRNGNLATIVKSMEVVTASGEVVVLSSDDIEGDFHGAVIGLGGVGAVTKLTLDIVPTFQMRQDVCEDLPLSSLEEHLDDIFSSAYSVSLFTDWRNSSFNQVWLKRRLTDPSPYEVESGFFGATPAKAHLHPVPGHAAKNCTEQMGIHGPWHERMPHFRTDFTPSSGTELQSEYFVPRRHAYAALCAIDRLSEHFSPLLYISEVRSIAADDLWMSPCYKQDSIAIHFTWKDDWRSVRKVLPLIEEQLAPFNARPHWGKLFTVPSSRLSSLYAKLPDFRRLLRKYDPQGKFRNEFLNTYIFSE
jgi:alditol oxidase